MRPLIEEISSSHTPESLVFGLRDHRAGRVLLRSSQLDAPHARYSFVAARPFLTFRSFGSRAEIHSLQRTDVQFGNPWALLNTLMSRSELLEELDLPFPLGGCFGYWGYDLKNFVEPKLSRRALNDLELPDCHIGFYGSLVVFDHHLGRSWIVSTGLGTDGSRDPRRAQVELGFWRDLMSQEPPSDLNNVPPTELSSTSPESISSNFDRVEFLRRVERAQAYICAGDIYQVNLSQ